MCIRDRDTQKIKNAAYVTDPSQTGKLATIGALSLYLDFINLFLYLLRIFGGPNTPDTVPSTSA